MFLGEGLGEGLVGLAWSADCPGVVLSGSGLVPHVGFGKLTWSAGSRLTVMTGL